MDIIDKCSVFLVLLIRLYAKLSVVFKEVFKWTVYV